MLAVGELLWDVLPDERKLGGAPANLAYRLNGLGNPTRLLTRLGNDADGIKALEILKQHNINTDFIQTDDTYPTGTVDVFFDQNKNPDYTINTPVAYDFITTNHALETYAAQAHCIVFGTLVQRSDKTAQTLHQLIDKAQQATKFCDVNLRKNCYNQAIVKKSLEKANIAKLNHHEAFELGQMFQVNESELIDIVKQLVQKFSLDICLITIEDKGALAVDKHFNIHYSPGYKVQMEDPLGAGDAFSAAFLNDYMKTSNITSALEAGNLFGAIVVGQKGAMQSITNDMLQNFNKNAERNIIAKYQLYWNAEQAIK